MIHRSTGFVEEKMQPVKGRRYNIYTAGDSLVVEVDTVEINMVFLRFLTAPPLMDLSDGKLYTIHDASKKTSVFITGIALGKEHFMTLELRGVIKAC